MPIANLSLSVNCGGVLISKSWQREGEHPNPYEVELPAADAGALTTRTGDDSGVVTMEEADHGLESDDVVDVYWDGGMRYGMTAAVSELAVTLSGGAGDDFPAKDTEVQVCLQVVIPTQIDGDQAACFALSLEYADSTSTAKGHVDMQDSGDATVKAHNLDANKPVLYDVDAEVANPITGNPITQSFASHNDTVNAATIKIVALEDFYYA